MIRIETIDKKEQAVIETQRTEVQRYTLEEVEEMIKRLGNDVKNLNNEKQSVEAKLVESQDIRSQFKAVK